MDQIIDLLIECGCTDEQIISRFTEMPHIVFSDGKPFDIEIENHTRNYDELVSFFVNVISGKTFSYKYEKNIQLTATERYELRQYLTSNPAIRMVLTKRYGKEQYRSFCKMLKRILIPH